MLKEWRETGLRQQRLSQDRMESDRWNKTGKWRWSPGASELRTVRVDEEGMQSNW